MLKRENKTRKGFTIIEVVLVLAIAGLIFLMVFVALPQLQRNQRDAQRRSDIAKVATAITQYQTNNGGKVPTPPGSGNYTNISCPYPDALNLNPQTYSGNNVACKLIAKYLNSSSSSKNEFIDPDGIVYSLRIQKYNGRGYHLLSFMTDGQSIEIRFNAKCVDGVEDKFYKTGRVNDYAIFYQLEGSGVYCVDNQ